MIAIGQQSTDSNKACQAQKLTGPQIPAASPIITEALL
jgi:hypothetical protein